MQSRNGSAGGVIFTDLFPARMPTALIYIAPYSLLFLDFTYRMESMAVGLHAQLG